MTGFAGEQAALRRVATLVARGAPPEVVLGAVTEEAARLQAANYAVTARYDPDNARTIAAWSSTWLDWALERHRLTAWGESRP